MPEVVKVEKEKVPVRSETGTGLFNDFFAPGFPSRFFARNPYAMMRDFSEEIEKAFGMAAKPEVWAPVVDIQKCNGDLVVKAELPGLKKEEVNVKVTDEAVVIEGERKREHTEDHEGYHRYERSYGRFYRSVPLPKGARPDEAKAELAEGVLKVTVPAPAEKKPERKITVEDKQAD